MSRAASGEPALVHAGERLGAAGAHNPWLVASSVMLVTFMEVLDTSIANVALPHIAGSLSATSDEATWVLTSYLVSNAIVLPATDWFSRLFGRKAFLLTCVTIFTLASIAAGSATSLAMLVVFRVIQGAGGGALQPTAQAVLLEAFPPAKRGVGMAAYGVVVVVAPILGPTLGGWITDNYSWRWIFYINLPFGIIAFLLAARLLVDPPYARHQKGVRIDYIGFAFMAIALGTLQVVLDKGQQEDWLGSAWIRHLSIICVISLVAFIARELWTDHPIVDLRILRNRNFGAGCFLIFVVGVVLYSTIAALPLFLQNLMGYTALTSGEALSPRGFGSMAAMLIVGRLIGRIDTRFLIGLGFALLGWSVWLLNDINLEIGMWNIIWPNVLNGFSLGLIFVPLSTIAVATLRIEQIGNATGIYNLMRNIGGSVGISAMTTLLARRSQVHQVTLVGHITPYDTQFNNFFSDLTSRLPLEQSYASVYAIVIRQATLLAFIDIFRMLAFASLACVPLVLLIQKGHDEGKPKLMH